MKIVGTSAPPLVHRWWATIPAGTMLVSRRAGNKTLACAAVSFSLDSIGAPYYGSTLARLAARRSAIHHGCR